jgi:hypothetical protein
MPRGEKTTRLQSQACIPECLNLTSYPRAPELHDNAPKRVAESKGQGFSLGTLAWKRAPRQCPQEESGTRRHHHRLCQSTELSLGNSPVTQRGPKGMHQEQTSNSGSKHCRKRPCPSQPSLHPLPPKRPKHATTTVAMVLAEETPMRPATRGRCPSVHAP